LPELLAEIKDRRKFPQVPTSGVVQSALIMLVGRVGSLNALEELQAQQSRHVLLGQAPISADTIGRVFSGIDSDSIRKVQRRVYSALKRSKALATPSHGLVALVIDGHESHSTRNQKCDGCLVRKKDSGDEYYHRNVTAQLVFDNFSFFLDAEPQLKGEGETTAARRLFARVVNDYPRAFDVVLADALYCNGPFIRMIVDAGKDIVTVLKERRRQLFREVNFAFQNSSPVIAQDDGRRFRQCWDEGNFKLDGLTKPLRAIKSLERKTVRRQISPDLASTDSSLWMWITTLPKIAASTETVVRLGHDRWSIENDCFNELVNRWHADHVYKHDPRAILNFWLLSLLAQNLFSCFYHRNLKPAIKASCSRQHVSRQMTACLYFALSTGLPP